MSNEIVKINADKIATMTGYSAEEVAIVKSSVAKNTTDTELAYFLNVCKSVELNPFNKEIWCYKDNKGNLLVFTGRDGFLSKAQRSPVFNGIRSSEVCENDEFELDIANGKIKHTFNGKNRGNIIGAYAITFRKDGEPTIEYVDIKDYDKKQFTWSTHKADMIKKVAETKALKKGFGISGVQSEYDFDIKNNIAIPISVEKTDETIRAKELIDLIDQIKEPGLKELYKDECRKAKEAGEFNLDFIEKKIVSVKKESK